MSDIDEIKARVDIVDVVSGYLPLKKAGRNFKSTCPFHTEKTPSFVVNPERQSWHCFGACATGGDVISFVMRQEKLEFGDALRTLADTAGIKLQPSSSRRTAKNERLYRLNQEAVRFYRQVLESDEGAEARRYLESRGVDADTAASFEIGLSPRGRDGLKAHLSSLQFDIDLAVEAGLLRRGDDSQTRDFFWGRLMFPIHDRRGRVAGFGGRSMDGSDPKYINTAAGPVFDKQATIYALHKAADSIREQDEAVVVEGYMDTIAAHQHGYPNVVASMGTALTERQVGQLKSLATNFVLALDPDEAGQEAVLRSLEASWRVIDRFRIGRGNRAIYRQEPLSLKIASLPDGLDPDELIRGAPERWEAVIGAAVPYMEFMIPAIIAKHDISNAAGKGEAAEAVAPFMASVSNAVEQDQYMQLAAQQLDVRREALEAAIGSARAVGRRAPERRSATATHQSTSLDDDKMDRLGDYVLSLLLHRPEFREQSQDLLPEYLQTTESRIVLSSLRDNDTVDELRESLDESLQDHFEYLTGIDLGPIDLRSAEEALKQGIERLEQRHFKELQLSRLASEDSAIPLPREFEGEFVSYNSRLKRSDSRRS